jgi:hypothetical protein
MADDRRCQSGRQTCFDFRTERDTSGTQNRVNLLRKNSKYCKSFLLPALLLFGSTILGLAQEQEKPLDAADPRLTSSFAIHAGGKPLRFTVELDKIGEVTGLQVFRHGEKTPLQTLPVCGDAGLAEQVTDAWESYDFAKLVKHADLNFDGFEDVELLQDHSDHLAKYLYCIYLWDQKAGKFHLSDELTNDLGDPIPHPENRTLTTHEDWFGGPWQDSTYRWVGDKLELIQQVSLLGDWSTQTEKQCGFDYSCGRLIHGKWVTTLDKPICTDKAMNDLPDCPTASTTSPARISDGKSGQIKKD